MKRLRALMPTRPSRPRRTCRSMGRLTLRLRRPARRTPRTPSHPTSRHVPWWVRWFTNGGRPVVAAVVLIMCAPGEHHLAHLAGWDTRLAWGMAAVLAAYAGIAASVASNRPAGSPGKVSAVVGAFVSLGAAMAAQPVSHLFVTGWFSAHPRPPFILVVIVSCVPPLVFGHLLHLAATPITTAVVPPTETPEPGATHPASGPSQPETPRPPVVPAGITLLSIVAAHTETLDDERDANGKGDDGDRERRLIETREVAALKGVKPSTVRTWVDRGRLEPVVRDARNGMLFDRSDVEALG